MCLVGSMLGVVIWPVCSRWKFELLRSISTPPTNGSFVYTVTRSTKGDHGPACNAAGMIDRCGLGLNHLYTKLVCRNLKECNISNIGQISDNSPSWCHAPFDLEGILLNKPLYTISYMLVTSASTGITFSALYILGDPFKVQFRGDGIP